MSPTRTFHNCGNSSRLVFEGIFRFLTRGSFFNLKSRSHSSRAAGLSFDIAPKASYAFGTMDRNL